MPYYPTPRLKQERVEWYLYGISKVTFGSAGEFPFCLLNPTITKHGGSTGYYYNKVTYGSDIPGWKTNIAEGVSATTSLVGEKRTLTWFPVEYFRFGNGGTPYVSPCVTYRYEGVSNSANAVNNLPSAVMNPAAEGTAARAFLKSFLKERVHFRGGSVLAEFTDTLRMLKNPVQSVYKSTSTFVGRVGRLKRVYEVDPVRYGDLLSGLWLNWSFGVKPLLSDVNEVSKALENLSSNLGSVDTTRITGSGKVRTFLGSDLATVAPSGSFRQYIRRTLDESVNYTGAIRCRPPGFSAIAESFGFTFEDIAPAVWEAVPWSFLVDYFVNVGEKLDSIRLVTADISWLKRTYKNQVIHGGQSPFRWTTFPGTTESCKGGLWRATAERVTRQDVTGYVPYPPWTFNLPGDNWSFSRWLNVGALSHLIANSKPIPPRRGPRSPRINISDL